VAGEESRAVLATLEASLALRVRVEGGRIVGLEIEGKRPLQAARVLEGRSVEAALAALPVMFRLCGTAQSVAGLQAVEAALECGPGPVGRAARSMLVTVEALEQSLWRILLDWPRCADGQPDAASLDHFRRKLRALQRGVFTDRRWNRLGGARVKADDGALRATIEGVDADIDEILFGGVRGAEVLASRPAFEAWIGDTRTATASALEWVYSNGLADFGGADVRLAGDFDTDYVSDRLAGDDNWAYCERPEHHGEVHQTGALARWSDAPLVRALHGEHGYGLVEALREHMLTLAPEEPNGATAITTGRGLGSVETARGRLFHWVEVREGTVARYRTLAPTEWNFHPDGPLAAGLVGAPAGDADTTRRAVDLLVTAIDPCVGVELELAEA